MPKISVIETGTPTPSGSSITDNWVEYKGQRVTEVPAGENFNIYAKGTAKNPDALTWDVLITVFSSDGSIAAYDTSDAYGSTYNTPKMKLDTPAPGFSAPKMPNKDITLNFRLFGNDTRGQTIPPITNW